MLIVLAVLVLVFGANWLPKAARNLGRAKVELDNTQRQIAETKKSVIEATGIEKADQALKKANRALNTSPQKLIRDAAMKPTKPALAQTADDGPEVAEPAGDSAADSSNPVQSEDQVNTGTVNTSITTSSVDEDPTTAS